MDSKNLKYRVTASPCFFVLIMSLVFVCTQITIAQSPIKNGKIPKGLEIKISSGHRGHGSGSQSRTIMRSNRTLEYSYFCGGCLPRNPRNILDLLNLQPDTPENRKRRQKEKEKRERAERERIASLKERVPKSRIKVILARLSEYGFFKMDSEPMFCEVENFPQSGIGRGIAVEFEGFSIKVGASEGCDLDSDEKTEQRERFFELYDFIVASLKDVRTNEVPWRSDIERKLRRHLENGDLPEDLEIIAESDESGLGTRLRLNNERLLSKASYSARNTFIIDGAEITHWDKRNKEKLKKAPKLKKRVSKKKTKAILESFLNSGFFGMSPNLRGTYGVTGPPKYTSISVRVDGLTKQTKCQTFCSNDTSSPCIEFCKLFDLIKNSVSGVKAMEELW